MFKLSLLVLLTACGGTQHPRSSGMKELAAEIDAELAEVAKIIHDRRADCPRMAAEMKTLFVRMRVTIDRANEAQKDPALAKELTTEMRAYDDIAKKRDAAIDADLAENSTCVSDPTVRDTMMTMPTIKT